MTVKELIEKLDLKILVEDDLEREVKDCYIGDLLSWVMGRAQADNAWITIMNNINVIAVASLADTACVILAEGVTLDDEIKTAAEQKDINVLASPLPAFETAEKLYGKV